jgi:hypothetical protein
MEDETREIKDRESKFEVLLGFIDGEKLKNAKDIVEGKRAKLEGEGEINSKPAESQFYDDVESLPGRRVSKPPLKEDYIAKKMLEFADKFGIGVGTPSKRKAGEKQITHTRRIIKKNG